MYKRQKTYAKFAYRLIKTEKGSQDKYKLARLPFVSFI